MFFEFSTSIFSELIEVSVHLFFGGWMVLMLKLVSRQSALLGYEEIRVQGL